MRARPEVLLFDLGGVLIENALFDELPKLLPEPVAPDALRRRWLFSPAVQAYERGETGTEAFLSAFIAEWGLAVTAVEFLEAFTSWPRGPYPGALELLETLGAKYRLAVLSNCNPAHWDRLLDVRSRVEAAYSSHELGLVKPDPLIFRRVAERLGTEPERICFFDDSTANVEAARSVGLQAFQTDGIDALVRVVRELNI